MLSKISARLRKREGFTLIELLVVVAIIGLLATLAIPRVVESMNKAKKAQGDADVHTISMAVEQLYMEDQGAGYLFVGDDPDTTTVTESLDADDIKAEITDTGLLKAHAKELVNSFKRGYIYISPPGGDWYALIDPANTEVGDVITLQCGVTGSGTSATPNELDVTVDDIFTVLSDVDADDDSNDDITSDHVKNNKCTAEDADGNEFTVVTN